MPTPSPSIVSPAVVQATVVQGLRNTIADLELEQASHGLDSWGELELHAVLAAAFVDAGCFVAREQRYPNDRVKKARTSGRRCDLVVTLDGPLLLEHVQPELFGPADVTSTNAAWIEVKVLKQHGTGGRGNVGWQQSLLSPPIADIKKLADDHQLGSRLLVMIFFTAAIDVSEHDFGVWLDVVNKRGLAVSALPMEHVRIVDRRNNRVCSVAVVVVEPSTT